MFLHPTYNQQVLNERLDVIEFCMKQKNADVLHQMLDCLKHVKSVTVNMCIILLPILIIESS